MDKQQVVRQFFDKGLLLSPEMLEALDEKSIEAVLRTQQASLVLLPGKAEDDAAVTVRMRQAEERQRMTVADIAAYYTNTYECLKAMLLRKTNAVSINKARTDLSRTTIIGMVRAAHQQGYVVEDPTGEIDVSTTQPLAEDDVVAITGMVKEGRLFAETITYPDIPLNRPMGTAAAVVHLAATPGNRPNTITPAANPCHLQVAQGGSSVAILAYRPKKPCDIPQAVAWLRKRHLAPEKADIRTTDAVFVIDPVPDIFWIVSPSVWSHIYKGTLILSCESARVDLKAMEAEFIKPAGNISP